MSTSSTMNEEKSGGSPSITGTTRGNAWSITINNPTEDDQLSWRNAASLPWVKEVKGQLEKGENGTLHVQGFLRTDQVRFSQVKKAFPRAHIEVARNVNALARYVSKEETRVATIDHTLVATPLKVQTSLTEVVLEHLTHKGQPCLLLKTIENPGEKNQTIVWKKQISDWETIHPNTHMEDYADTDTDRSVALMEKNEEFIQSNADMLVDKVVNKLIRSGYYTVEFVMSNNQVRGAYKRYLTSICIRNVRQSQEVRPPTQVNSSSPYPEEEIE